MAGPFSNSWNYRSCPETWGPLQRKEVVKSLNTMAGQAKVMGGGRHNGWSYRLVCIYILAWAWELIATKNPEERGQRGMEIDLKRTASRSTRTNNVDTQTNLQSTSYGITAVSSDLDFFFFLLDRSVYIASPNVGQSSSGRMTRDDVGLSRGITYCHVNPKLMVLQSHGEGGATHHTPETWRWWCLMVIQRHGGRCC